MFRKSFPYVNIFLQECLQGEKKIFSILYCMKDCCLSWLKIVINSSNVASLQPTPQEILCRLNFYSFHNKTHTKKVSEQQSWKISLLFPCFWALNLTNLLMGVCISAEQSACCLGCLKQYQGGSHCALIWLQRLQVCSTVTPLFVPQNTRMKQGLQILPIQYGRKMYGGVSRSTESNKLKHIIYQNAQESEIHHILTFFQNHPPENYPTALS